MRRSFAVLSCAAAALTAKASGAQPSSVQTKVPIVDLAPAMVKSHQNFGSVLGVKQLPGNRLLVNDAGRRQMWVLDSSFAGATLVLDSAAGSANAYGPQPAPLINFLGDSSLFIDSNSQSLLVLDGNGHVAHAMALPSLSTSSNPLLGALAFLIGGNSYVDNKGRLLFRAPQITFQQGPQPSPSQGPVITNSPDSAYIIRLDFDSRKVDTVAQVKVSSGRRTTRTMKPDGSFALTVTLNPVQTLDDWAVLSDGSVAFVRGHDYHMDWLDANGSWRSTAKLPFDWRRLTDDDKQALIDSARKAQDAIQAKAQTTSINSADGDAARAMSEKAAAAGAGGGAAQQVIVMRAGDGGGGGGGGPVFSGGPGGAQTRITTPTIEFVPLKEIADYYPPIRQGAAKPDADGNLWVLPTTSGQSLKGELVYDVINKKGELFRRVRIPAGRSIAGFGRGGVVYLQSGSRADGWYLERGQVIGGTRASN